MYQIIRITGRDGTAKADPEAREHLGPEGFLIREDGPFGCELSGVEVMGRDISVVSTHKASLNPAVRAIVSAESGPLAAGGQVRFSLKPGKVFLFRKDTEERIL